MVCTTRAWHPNINLHTGVVSLPIITKDWRPVLSINTVVFALQVWSGEGCGSGIHTLYDTSKPLMIAISSDFWCTYIFSCGHFWARWRPSWRRAIIFTHTFIACTVSVDLLVRPFVCRGDIAMTRQITWNALRARTTCLWYSYICLIHLTLTGDEKMVYVSPA